MNGLRPAAARLLPLVLFVSFCLSVSPGHAAPPNLSWAHERSDLKPDPRVKFGKLANGMRYALMRNSVPASAVTMYLRIAAGSLHEADDQRGLAHFLEHLAFQGSKNVPRGEMLKMLQRLGANPGADANAYTSFDETVYQLELPKSDAATVDTGLTLMREIADRLSLTAEAAATERGVVVEELKLSDQPNVRSARRQFSATFDGLRHLDRWPIGERAVIEKASIELIRKFYREYYRPERGLLIIVGDIDRDEMEKKVAGLFADWKQPGPAGVDPDLGRLKSAELRASAYFEPTLREQVSLSWARPDERPAPTKAEYVRAVRKSVTLTLLNRRLSAIAGGQNAPFESAEVSIGGLSRTVQLHRLTAVAKPGQWKAALEGIDREMRRMAAYGVSQVEFNRELVRSRAAAAEAAGSASAWSNTLIVTLLLSSVNADFVFTPASDLATLREEALQGFTAADMNAIARDHFKDEPSVVFLSSPSPVAGGESEILDAYRKIAATPVAPPPVVAEMPFPYSNFGAPGKVAARREIAEFGATEVKFENGVRLHVRPTDYVKGEIGVVVRVPGGALDFPRDRPVQRSFYSNLWLLGGLNEIDIDHLADKVTGKSVGLAALVDEDAYQLAGATNATDFPFQMQVLAAFATDPAFRTQPLERLKASYADAWRQRRATPRAALGLDLAAILHANDARWIAPTVEQVNTLTADDIRKKLMPILRRRPIDVTIVGSVTVDAAIDIVAKTFGALPKRGPEYKPPAGARDVRFPARKQQIVLTHEGGVEQAIASVAWPGPDVHTNNRQGRAFRLLAGIIDSELNERLRSLGKTYAASALGFRSGTFPHYGYMFVRADTAPADVDLVYREIDGLLAAIKKGDLSDDAILRTRTPLVTDIERTKRSNAYWLETLSTYQADPRVLAEQQTITSDYRGITKEEIVEVARTFLTDERRVEIRVMPANAAVAALPMRILASDWLTNVEKMMLPMMGFADPTLLAPKAPTEPTLGRSYCSTNPDACAPGPGLRLDQFTPR